MGYEQPGLGAARGEAEAENDVVQPGLEDLEQVQTGQAAAAQLAEKAVEIARRNMQIHGGVGYTQEYGAEKLLRDALVLPVYEGTSQIQSLMAMKDTLLARLGGGLQTVGNFPVEAFITTDGYKFILPNREWVAFRASGTEPLIRCYIEARSKSNLKKLQVACRHLLA